MRMINKRRRDRNEGHLPKHAHHVTTRGEKWKTQCHLPKHAHAIVNTPAEHSRGTGVYVTLKLLCARMYSRWSTTCRHRGYKVHKAWLAHKCDCVLVVSVPDPGHTWCGNGATTKVYKCHHTSTAWWKEAPTQVIMCVYPRLRLRLRLCLQHA